MTDAASRLAASGLGKRYGEQWAVHEVDLDVDELRVVGLVGPSGCGKTTLVRLMNGSIAPDAGEVRLLGIDPRHANARQRQRIGYLPQQPVLFPELTLWENLNFHASLAGVRWRRRARLHELLDFVDLGPDRRKKVHEASGGMQRRLALAATLVHKPEVLFLDEPTAGIDPILRRRIWERFRDLRDQGTLLVVTTQYVAEAAYCDDVGVLSAGRLLSLSSPGDLTRSAYGGEVLQVTSGETIPSSVLQELARRMEGIAAFERPSATTTWIIVDDASVRAAPVGDHLRDLGVGDVTVEQPPTDFDDVFVRIIERSRRSEADDAEHPGTETDPAAVTA